MTPDGSRSTRTSRVIAASPSAVYAAFVDPDALVAWLPPGRMTGRFHAFDARVGGGYEMSLFYPSDETEMQGKTATHEDRVVVTFNELVPDHRIVERVRFVSDDPAFGGEMTQTITLEAVPDGTRITLAFDDLPPGLRPEDNDTGARESLDQLARYLGA